MRFNIRLRFSPHFILTAAATLACAYSPLAIVQAEAQTTYYVAPNGNDYNNGSINSPWLTPQHSSAVAQPGDTVIFEDGTYNLAGSGGTGDWFISSGGTSGHPVTYVAQHKWQAKLVGHGSGDGTTVIGLAGGYTIIKDFDITGSNANGINLTTNGTSASYNQAVGNYIHDMVTPCNSDSGAGITTGSGGNNYAGVGHESTLGNLIVNLVAAGGCPGGHQASGIAMMLPYGIVANNIVINCGDAIEAWHAATNTTFFGNIVLNSLRGLSMGAGDSPGGVTNNNSLVQNNIIINGSNPAIIETGATGTNNVYKNNLVFGGNTSIQLNNGLQATGTINANPQFVNNTGTASGDYRLQSNSPARGAGLALAGIITDFAGNARPQSGTTDIGAYLYDVSSSSTPTVAINASPTSLSYGGGSSTISWSTTNATSATLNGASVPVNSSITVSPTATTTYTLAAQSASGATASNSVTVTVGSSGPVAAGISANTTSIVSGNSATLTWTSNNAVSGSLNGTPVPVNGTLVVQPTTTTTYRFTATSASGTTDWGQVTVNVTAAPSGPVAAGASASPSSITSGQSSVITWTTKNAVSATLNGSSVPLNGSITVTPTSTTTYRITATDATGKTDSGSATVTVTAPPTGPVAAGASASPSSITSGQSSVITWTTKNAVSATLNGSSVPLNGSITVTPTSTTTYRISATDATGKTDWGSATVTVTAAPTGPVAAGASASPSSIRSGGSSVITWTTRNAVSATLNGTSVPLNGSITVSPTSTTTYRITATDATGKTDWGSATVTVN